MTKHAKISLAIRDLCRKIDPHRKPSLSILWSAKRLAMETYHKCENEKGFPADFGPEQWLSIGIAKAYNERPQDVSDMIQSLLGWRSYNNVHDTNKISWGFPPECLGGEGSYWTWKASETDFGLVLKHIIQEI